MATTDEILATYEQALGRVVLACVHSSRLRLGVRKIIAILQGSKAAFITRHRLHLNPCYGILACLTGDQLESIIRALLRHRVLTQQYVGTYGLPILTVTPLGLGFLNGVTSIGLDVLAVVRENDIVLLADDEARLFEALRGLRRDIANSIPMPAYRVCKDSTLRLIARDRPSTVNALLAIRGIGPTFVKAYGESFLTTIRAAA